MGKLSNKGIVIPAYGTLKKAASAMGSPSMGQKRWRRGEILCCRVEGRWNGENNFINLADLQTAIIRAYQLRNK